MESATILTPPNTGLSGILFCTKVAPRSEAVQLCRIAPIFYSAGPFLVVGHSTPIFLSIY